MEASALDTPIIVGCGEPFDHSTVPQSLLSFHSHGGGRSAAKTVKKEIAFFSEAAGALGLGGDATPSKATTPSAARAAEEGMFWG